MIPNVIHYCWFGDQPLDDEAQKCIASWRRFFPNYEIKEWNEKNFDIDSCDYIKQAYEARQWAFVSDYARFWILYHEGGIYFDTDVEVINPIDDILSNGAFMGMEKDGNGKKYSIAPGLGMAAPSNMSIFKDIIDSYHGDSFKIEEKTLTSKTVVIRVSDILRKYGYNPSIDKIQKIAGIYIYPSDYFCPIDFRTGIFAATDNTRSIHHYKASWMQEHTKNYFLLRHEAYASLRKYIPDIPARILSAVLATYKNDGITGLYLRLKNNKGN